MSFPVKYAIINKCRRAAIVSAAVLSMVPISAHAQYNMIDSDPKLEDLRAIFARTPPAKPETTRSIVMTPDPVRPSSAETPVVHTGPSPVTGIADQAEPQAPIRQAASGYEPGAPDTGSRPQTRIEQIRTVNARIQFEINSTRILPRYRSWLSTFAEAIGEFPSTAFEIGGHADASGSDDLNLWLSQARAETVRQHLIAVHGIEPDRLIARGYGESRLLPDLAATDPRHRRVSFTPLN